MKKFRVSSTVTVSVFTIVEAEDEQSAIEATESRELQTLPEQAKGNENEEFVVTELDGEINYGALKAEEDFN